MDMQKKVLSSASGDGSEKHKTANAIRNVSLPLGTVEPENRVSNGYTVALFNAARNNASKNTAHQILGAKGTSSKFQNVQVLALPIVKTSRLPNSGASAREYFKQNKLEADLVELIAICSRVGLRR
ncbi:hypothetical protein [Undibacterium terreum]|uniref:Uncharacterized protein n=1 Tax=Undibacterium terreum TaxID=1224302 RepID=A0A916UJE2_9BURK|nr:hypothetical protein [Undibacterium terreum]GGC75310.1 hypothetical protein GCM10011396_23170 [Undibacterium terreum]